MALVILRTCHTLCFAEARNKNAFANHGARNELGKSSTVQDLHGMTLFGQPFPGDNKADSNLTGRRTTDKQLSWPSGSRRASASAR
jgi:hypothetical protein